MGNLKLIKVSKSSEIDETVRTVQITKCSGEYFWYKDKIGNVYDVRLSKMDTNCYDVIEQINPLVRRIHICDCKEMGRKEKIERIKNRI